jgi:Arc/MetJ-type ribon-helix-helix transcriptional regulator
MAAKQAKQPTDRVTVRLPVAQIQQMQALVDAGMYRNTTDVVYNALKALLMAKGGEAKTTIEAQKGLLDIQRELALIAAQKKQLGLS